jgi:hypothetical protein
MLYYFTMPLLKSKLNIPKTRVYIETGTYLGNGIREVLNEYESIHSIELSPKWYMHNVQQFKDHENVHLYCGDSKKVLPELLKLFNEPVTIYLDAHYSGHHTAFGDEETPLLQELEILREREYNDIIIVDDCRLVGSSGVCGGDYNDPVYPRMNYDWSHITFEKIKNLMKPGYSIFDNRNRDYTTGGDDQLILVRPVQNLNER